jgi:tetratricopeptide (TPR) repeat protein
LLDFYDERLPQKRRLLLGLVALFHTPVSTETLTQLAHSLPGVCEHFGDAADSEIESALTSLTHEQLLVYQPSENPAAVGYTIHPILRDFFRARILGGSATLARRFADIVAGRPSFLGARTLDEIRPVLNAIDILLEAGDYRTANSLFQNRLNEGDLFLRIPAPDAGFRCCLGFVGSRERREKSREQLGASTFSHLLLATHVLAGNAGEIDLAAEFTEEWFKVESDLQGHRWKSGEVHHQIADEQAGDGRCEQARRNYEEALAAARRVKNYEELRNTLGCFASSLHRQGRVREAAQNFIDGDKISRTKVILPGPLDGQQGMAWVDHFIAIALPNRARATLEYLRKSFEKGAHRRSDWLADCDLLQSRIESDPLHAQALLNHAEKVLRDAHLLTSTLASVLVEKADCLRRLGQPEEAAAAVEEALSLAAARKFRSAQTAALIARSRLRLDLADREIEAARITHLRNLGRDDAEHALKLGREVEDIWEQRRALETLVRALRDLGADSERLKWDRELARIGITLDQDIETARKITNRYFDRLETDSTAEGGDY